MSFDRLAPHYRWMEAVLAGDVLQRSRTAFLDRARDSESILLLGEGNGRFLEPLLAANPGARVIVVEESPAMIRQARARLGRCGADAESVEFVTQDALEWEPPPETFDLIVTHFFLDCFTGPQLRRLVPRVASSARPAAIWLLADFQVPPEGLPRLRAQAIHRLMYAFFRMTAGLPARQLTPPGPFLEAAGFRRIAHVTAEWGLLHTDCWTKERRAGDA